MIIDLNKKNRITEAIKGSASKYSSNAKFAIALGINAAQLSRILKGDFDGVLSDQNWISIARRLNVELSERKVWHTAKTETFQFINAQLQACHQNCISGFFCDAADIGKTHTAKHYVLSNKYAIYIDCSQVKSKQKYVRTIAQELGLKHTGRYAEVYEDLVFYLKNCGVQHLIVLDEFGDLDYPAVLETKALWNATEGECAWYLMGADGLKAKFEKNLSRSTVGYTELFSRFGSRYQKVVPEGKEAKDSFINTQIAQVAKLNNENVDVRKLIANSRGSLRRVKIELQKSKIN